MVTKDEALKMAILQMKAYGFKHLCDYQCDDKELLEVIKICEKALAQPAKEPVTLLNKMQSITEQEYYD